MTVDGQRDVHKHAGLGRGGCARTGTVPAAFATNGKPVISKAPLTAPPVPGTCRGVTAGLVWIASTVH
jgi:hypothetical protein